MTLSRKHHSSLNIIVFNYALLKERGQSLEMALYLVFIPSLRRDKQKMCVRVAIKL